QPTTPNCGLGSWRGNHGRDFNPVITINHAFLQGNLERCVQKTFFRSSAKEHQPSKCAKRHTELIERIRQLTPYREINELLSDFTSSAKEILRENLVGLYLSGSLTYGDFVPERSDIDLEVVVRQPLGESELNSIEQLHRDLNNRHAAWKNRLECSYVPIELMTEIMPPKTPRPWWGFDRL